MAANDKVIVKVGMPESTLAQVKTRMPPSGARILMGQSRSEKIVRDLDRLYALYGAVSHTLRETLTPVQQRFIAEAWQAADRHGILPWYPGILAHALQSAASRGAVPKGVDVAALVALFAEAGPLYEAAMIDAAERWAVAGADPKAEPLATR